MTPEPPPDGTPGPVELPIDGELDLHAFRPREVPALVADYLDACRERGILHVRIVHGKGIGALRASVQRVLERRDDVVRFRPDSESGSAWGATLVDLAPRRRGPSRRGPPRPRAAG